MQYAVTCTHEGGQTCLTSVSGGCIQYSLLSSVFDGSEAELRANGKEYAKKQTSLKVGREVVDERKAIKCRGTDRRREVGMDTIAGHSKCS